MKITHCRQINKNKFLSLITKIKYCNISLKQGRFFTTGLLVLFNTISYPALAEDNAINSCALVTTSLVQPYENIQKIEVPGVWVARNEITVSSPLQAIRIKKIWVDEGDIVKAGQILAELEDVSLLTNFKTTESQLAQVKAKIEEIKVRKKEADSLYQRSRQLLISNAISKQQLDELQASAQSLYHQLIAIEAEQLQVEQQLIESQSQLDKSKIRSPVDGIISLRYVHEGELVNFSQLFKLISNNQIEFEAMVTQNLMAQLTQDMPVQATNQNTLVDAKIRLIGTSIQKETGIATIRIKPINPINVSSGTAGKAIFNITSSSQKTIDTRALRYDGIAPYVFIVDENNIARIRPIKLGPRYIDRVVVEQGLEMNDPIILLSAVFLKDGDCIKMVPESKEINNAEETTNTEQMQTQKQEQDVK